MDHRNTPIMTGATAMEHRTPGARNGLRPQGVALTRRQRRFWQVEGDGRIHQRLSLSCAPSIGRRALSLGWCGNALTTPVRLTTRSWACAQAHARAAVCQQQLPPRWSPPGRAPHGRRRRRSEPAPEACAARATTVCRGIWGGDGLPPRGRRSAGDMINLSTQLGERGCCLRAGPRVHASSGAAI